MVAVVFSAILILGLVSLFMHWVMRIRLLRLDSGRDKIEWLSFRSGDDVLSTYEECRWHQKEQELKYLYGAHMPLLFAAILVAESITT